jgi:hypothetical protein
MQTMLCGLWQAHGPSTSTTNWGGHVCYRMLEEDADVDEDVARLLEGTGGDPDAIREKALHRTHCSLHCTRYA